MNVEDWEAAALHEIVARVTAEAEARGAEVLGSELVGLMPAGAALAAAGSALRIAGFDASHVTLGELLLPTDRGPSNATERRWNRNTVIAVCALVVVASLALVGPGDVATRTSISGPDSADGAVTTPLSTSS